MPRAVGAPIRTFISIAILIVPVVLTAQTTPVAPPEIGRLAYFLGSWQVETTTASAQGPAEAPTHSVHEYEYLGGTRFVVMHSKGSLPDTPALMAVLGYDPRLRTYTADFFTAPDLRIAMTGRVSGNLWTWLSRDGQLMQTIHMLSPSAFTYQIARSRGTIGWQILSESKAVRIGEAPAAPAP